MAGKGSKPRPLVVPKEQFDKSFENIFGKKEPKKPYVYVPPEKELDNEIKDK